MKIYTKTGDDGTTALFSGKRISKDDELLEVIGTIDELNCWLGNIRSSKLRYSIQTDLMVIMGVLGGWKTDLSILPEHLAAMETVIDTIEEKLPELHNFLIPGGSIKSAGVVHIARAVCRRAERRVVAYQKTAFVEPIILQYLNRLSDYLFVLARLKNKGKDWIWRERP